MPMPPSLTQTQREQITAALFRREDPKEIADANGISERQVRRISQNLRQYGTVNAPRLKKMGRPTCLNKEIEDDLRKFVAQQPLALLEDMQKHVQTTFNVKCSRASLSRRMREMGFTRGIIRRGFRSSDQSIPNLSAVDMARLMADQSQDKELMHLSGNAKKAKYAWLMEAEQPETTKTRKKREPKTRVDDVNLHTDVVADHQAQELDEEMVVSQYPNPVGQGMNESMPHISHDGYVPSYISPYRHVNGAGSLITGHAEDDPSRVLNVGLGPGRTSSAVHGQASHV